MNPEERQALAGSIVGALIGGDDASSLRYLDGTGRTVILTSRDGGPAMARHDDDGSPARPPLAALGPSAAAARSLVVVGANDLGVPVRPARDDEPAELLEARASLAEITEELEAARGLADAVAALRAELAEVDAQIRHVHDHAAQREYAKVLARLERVRAEAATLRSGRAGIDADRHLLAGAATVEDLSQRWSEAAEALAETRAAFGPERRVPSNELKAAAEAPDEVPTELPALVETLAGAERHHAELDHRLQVLSVAKLPAPSDLAVGELGLLDQGSLWAAADRLLAAREDVHRVQVSLGGLGGEDGDAGPAVIEEMEAAHRALDDAERAAESVRIPGVAGTALGATLTLAGTISGPLLIPLGLLIAGVVGTVTLLLPRSRVAKAAAVERVALDRAGAPTYLGFHLRRVDATVDPHLRSEVEAVTAGHRAAVVAWIELVGPERRRQPGQGARGRGPGLPRRPPQPGWSRRRDRAPPSRAGRVGWSGRRRGAGRRGVGRRAVRSGRRRPRRPGRRAGPGRPIGAPRSGGSRQIDLEAAEAAAERAGRPTRPAAAGSWGSMPARSRREWAPWRGPWAEPRSARRHGPTLGRRPRSRPS